MLTDLEFKEQPGYKMDLVVSGDENSFLVTAEGPETGCERLLLAHRVDVGIYWSRLLIHYFNMITDWEEDRSYPGAPWFHHGGLDGRPKEEVTVSEKLQAGAQSCISYGSADSLEQIREECSQYWDSPRSFILIISKITREGDAGWRWHKNGPYIGTQKPQREHFGDEPIIEEVVAFEFTEIKRKTA